jgi:hypothetical protein
MFYRLRRHLNYTQFRLWTRRIHASPPIACNTEPSCEIHTMLSQADVPLYLVAIKSLLRFYQDVGVVIHSDGTLSEDSEAMLINHLPGCRIVSASSADQHASQVLDKDSTLYKWRLLDASYRRLVDTELQSRAPARIIMDADILFPNRPHEVIEWIERGGSPFLLGQPRTQPTSTPINGGLRHMQDVFKENLSALDKSVGQPVTFLDGATSGFYGCTNELSLARAEKFLSTCLNLNIPMFKWGGEQCLVLYLLSLAGARRLGPVHYFNFFPSLLDQLEHAHAVHFFGTHRFFGNAYSRAAARIASGLSQPSAKKDELCKSF